MTPRLLGFLLGLVVLCCFTAAPSPVHAQAIQLYHVQFHDDADLTRLAATLDVWEVDHDAKTLLAPLSTAQAADLRLTRRIQLAPDQSPLQPRPFPSSTTVQTTGIPGFACYRTVGETTTRMAELAANAPDLASVVTIGPSWERKVLTDGAGHDLLVLRLTNRHTSVPKPVFFLMGALHARELTTAETALRFGELLVAEYGHNPTTTWLLDHTEVHILTIANPDGRIRAESGLLWRKNTNASAGQCEVSPPFGSYGVDLNRNSSFRWGACFGCSNSNPCSDLYRGVSPASEPETQAIENYLRTVITSRRAADLVTPVPDDTSGLLISLHSYGRLVLYPWGSTSQPSPNRQGLHTLGLKFGYHLGYRICQAGAQGCLYQTDGSTDDWAYGELGIPAYTFELGTAFFQSCEDFENAILPNTLAALRYALSVAALPYVQPAGPDIVALNTLDPGEATYTFRLQADSTRYAGDFAVRTPAPVMAARYALNAVPWDPSVPTQNFALVSGQETLGQAEFTTTLDTSCLAPGRHLLVAQAMSAPDAWGPPSAQFLDVPGNAVIAADLTATQTMPSVPVTHTLVITNLTTTATTYSVTGLPSRWPLHLPAALVGPVAPGAGVAAPVVVSPGTETAAAIAPAGVEIRSVDDPAACLRVYGATQVSGWILRLPIIANAAPQ